MVDLSLTDEQRAIQELAREFARREIRPVAAEYGEREEMAWPVLHNAAKVGPGNWPTLDAVVERSGTPARLFVESKCREFLRDGIGDVML